MGTRIFVGNLSFDTSAQDLHDLFAGDNRPVEKVSIVTDRGTGRSRGFGFVEMAAATDIDAVILAMGSERPADIKIPNRELKGVHFAMDYFVQQNRVNAGDGVKDQIVATGKNVIVIGAHPETDVGRADGGASREKESRPALRRFRHVRLRGA